MATPDNLWFKIFGDRRDQRAVVREAGFRDEAAAASWAAGLVDDDIVAGRQDEVGLIAAIRRARPDLTGRTASYIARQTITRRP